MIVTNTKQYLDNRFYECLASCIEARFMREVGSISYDAFDNKLVIRIGFKETKKV